ncbi:LOW QUALITY PROTEIN: hypothetical protein Cgig2_016952 [Carnegiea gigantea]|uniref:Uncharacterized protein n=1 Tax=Carnegiea gigantea TaxID=171969 RepID=A0A9Q1GIC9_9CARY|nr:LOW QUALITY PROTEIN: hypothetical protein Cgig2_016952 [Carnegiea gigantea]
MGTVDPKTGRVVGGADLDDDYDRCILHPTNGRQAGRPLSERRESQMQGTRCTKYSEVGHTRRTGRNPCADFDANYEGDVLEVEDLLDDSVLKHIRLQSTVLHNSQISTSPQHGNGSNIVRNYGVQFFSMFHTVRHPGMFTRQEANVDCGKPWFATDCSPSTLAFNSYWLLSCHHTPTSICILICKYIGACAWGAGMFTPICVLMMKYSFACSVLSGNLAGLCGRRQMFTVANHGPQPVNPWGTDRLQPWHFGILLMLASRLSPYPHPCLYFNVQVYWCMCMGVGMFTPICVLLMKYRFVCCVLSGNLACLPSRRRIFTMLKYSLQLTVAVELWHSTHTGFSAVTTPLPMFEAGDLACLPKRRQMLTVVTHGLQPVNTWGTDKHDDM